MNASGLLRSCISAAAWLVTLASLTGCAHLVVLGDALSASEHHDLGVIYEAGGQPALAEAEYRRSLRLDPHQSVVWVNRGNLEAAQGAWTTAEKRYRRALREAPANADAANNLAFALLQQGRLDAARGFALAAVSHGGARDSVYRDTLAEIERATTRGGRIVPRSAESR